MRHNKTLGFALLFSIGAILSGCKKDNPDPETFEYQGNGVFVLCEGGFNMGNARLDFYNETTSELQTNVYEAINGVPLGDVFQSMLLLNDKAFLVVNNSGKIEVLDANTLEQQQTISGFLSPRYLCQTGTSKAYVSDLFSGQISIVNLNNLTVTGSISLPGWSEEMLNDNGKVWVTNGMKDYTYIVQNDVVTDSVQVGYGSSSIRKSSDGDIWVLTMGNYSPVVNSKISRINPSTNAVEWDYELSNNGASRLRTSPDKATLYFIFDGKVYRKGAGDNSNPVEFISLPGKSFYALNVDPSNGNLWLGDAGDFASAGTVYVYNSAGTQIQSFTTGVAPTDFAF